jgi:hypothetical protein
MQPDADSSSSNLDADSAKPTDVNEAELEELEALSRAHNRDVALSALLRLIGPFVLVGILVAIATYTYVQISSFRTRARQELEKDPIRGMETILRAAGKDEEADQIFSGGVNFKDVERQMRDLENLNRPSK